LTDQVKAIDAASEKAKATSGTSVDSAALELICLDYVGGQTLQERLAVLAPEAVAKTFADCPERHQQGCGDAGH
jgi:hypothetical protein